MDVHLVVGNQVRAPLVQMVLKKHVQHRLSAMSKTLLGDTAYFSLIRQSNDIIPPPLPPRPFHLPPMECWRRYSWVQTEMSHKHRIFWASYRTHTCVCICTHGVRGGHSMWYQRTIILRCFGKLNAARGLSKGDNSLALG